jgi:fatty-acid desaturase
MQTIEAPSVAVTRPRLNMTVYCALLVAAFSGLVMIGGSRTVALVWMAAVTAAWILLETLATTVYVHRRLTHGTYRFRSQRVELFWLWWVRSGGVKYWEWVINHAWHHLFTDTPRDSYTPNAHNPVTDTPPLPPPRPWRFTDNAVSYNRNLRHLKENPEAIDELREDDTARRTLERLDELEWAKPVYGRTVRALLINWGIFTMAVLPLVMTFGLWWVRPFLLLALPWAMIGLKVYLYLLGGYIINYYGHQAGSEPYQTNVPWWLMILTLFMMGEGWHELHHDMPGSAMLHPALDPGWWVIKFMYRRGWIDEVFVAKATGTPRQYELVRYDPKNFVVAA